MRVRCNLMVGVIVLMVAAACGNDPPPPPETTDPGCEAAHPNRLVVDTQVEEEKQYLDLIVACTDDGETATLLVNGTDGIWTLNTTGLGASVTQRDDSPRLASFRTAARQVYPYEVMAPGTTVVVGATPQRVEWTLSPDLSAMWLMHEELADLVQEKVEGQLTELLGGGSPRRKAFLTCLAAVRTLVGEAGQGLSGEDPAMSLMSGLGIASSGTQCARDWQIADEEALARHQATVTWSDDVARLSREADTLATANKSFRRWHRLGRLAALFR